MSNSIQGDLTDASAKLHSLVTLQAQLQLDLEAAALHAPENDPAHNAKSRPIQRKGKTASAAPARSKPVKGEDGATDEDSDADSDESDFMSPPARSERRSEVGLVDISNTENSIRPSRKLPVRSTRTQRGMQELWWYGTVCPNAPLNIMNYHYQWVQ